MTSIISLLQNASKSLAADDLFRSAADTVRSIYYRMSKHELWEGSEKDIYFIVLHPTRTLEMDKKIHHIISIRIHGSSCTVICIRGSSRAGIRMLIRIQ